MFLGATKYFIVLIFSPLFLIGFLCSIIWAMLQAGYLAGDTSMIKMFVGSVGVKDDSSEQK